MSKVIVEYDPTFPYCVPDGLIEEEFEEILYCYASGKTYYKIVGNESLITRVRLGVVTGNLLFSDVKFVFNGEDILVNEYGVCKFTKGFCDTLISMSENILISSMKKYEEKTNV